MHNENIVLGKLTQETERDAIHVAIIPVIAGEKLAPGQDVSINTSGKAVSSEKTVGIIDPFLKNMVFPDQKCWVLLYPNTITGMRHHWEHPCVDHVNNDPNIATMIQDKDYSEQYMQEFAKSAGLEFHELIDILTEYVDNDEVWVEQGTNQARDVWYDLDREQIDKFWKHFEVLTGKKNTDNHYWDAPFSCSC